MDGLAANDASVTESDNDTLFMQTGIGEKAARATFLAIFVILGLVGNSVLIATIAQSQHLKVAVMNLFIISIASVNVVDTLLNLTLILGSSISERWNFGDFVCQLNAFCIHFVSIVMVMGLMCMCIDRFIAVKNVEQYRSKMTVKIANFCILFSWVYGIILSIPILSGTISSAPFISRYLCSITTGANVVYICFLSLFGYLIPVLVIFVLYVLVIYIGRNRIRAREMKRKETRKHKKVSTADDVDDMPDLSDEVDATKFVGVLIILWSVCEGPYLLIVSIEQYASSDSVNSSIEYPWQLELSFAWMRLSYVIILPILTIFWRNDFRMRIKYCILCKKMNNQSNINDEDQKDNASDTFNDKHKKDKKENGNVPVLYVTDEGLGLQVADRNTPDHDDAIELEPSEIEANMNSDSVSAPITTTTKCDVLGSQVNLQDDHEDTSDFEEEDPLAVSNAQSVKSKSSHGSRGSGADKSGRSTLTKRGGKAKKEEDRAKMKSETFVVEKPAKSKRKPAKLEKGDGKEKPEESEETIPKRERNDSGRGSLERPESKVNRTEKRKKKKLREEEAREKLSLDIERVLGDNTVKQHDLHHDVSMVAEENEDDYPKVKKKKKRRKKHEYNEEDVVNNDTGHVNEALEVDDPDSGRSRTGNGSDQIEEEPNQGEPGQSDKVLFTKVALTPEKRSNVRPLPQPHVKQTKKTHNRTYSDDLDVVDSNLVLDVKNSHNKKTNKSHHRSLSEDWDTNDLSERKNGKVMENPTPAPRKSKSKTNTNGEGEYNLVSKTNGARKIEKYNSIEGDEIQLEGSDWSDNISQNGEKWGSKTVSNSKPRKMRQSEI